MSDITEDRIREIVRDELEKRFIKDLKDSINSLNLAVKELRLIVDDLKEREKKSEERLDKLEKVTEQLVQWSVENTKVIQELRVAVQELRARTEENIKAVHKLVKGINSLTKSVDEGFKELMRDLDRLVSIATIMIENKIREGVIRWFKEKKIEVINVSSKTVRVGKRLLEFDIYAEAEDKIYVGDFKATLGEKDVVKFSSKVALLRSSVNKEVIPILIYRCKSGDPLRLAKGYGITVFKYFKGGELIEMSEN